MALDFLEKNEIDLSFEINSLIAKALESTVSFNIDENDRKNAASAGMIPKEKILQSVIANNFEKLEDSCYMTTGPEGTIYLAGSWLMREIFLNGRMFPMLFHLEENLKGKNVAFYPEKDGTDVRRKLWKMNSEINSSYDLSKNCKIEDALRDSARMPMMGPPPMPENKSVNDLRKVAIDQLVDKMMED